MRERRRRLGRGFFSVDASTLAPALLGKLLVRVMDDGQRLSGRIVEVEAYCGVRDAASHAFGGRRTVRNEAMYAAAGTAYVYFTYGMHHCFNVVCARAGVPEAVLIRAIEPLEGLERMRMLRASGSRGRSGRTIPDRDLCRGPGRVCQALGLDRDLNGVDLVRERRVYIADGGSERVRAVRTARIGVEYAGAWACRRLRWAEAGSALVSGARRRSR